MNLSALPLGAQAVVMRIVGDAEQFREVIDHLTSAAVRNPDALMSDRMFAIQWMAEQFIAVRRTAVQIRASEPSNAPMQVRAIGVAQAIERRVREGHSYADGRLTEVGAFAADVAARIAAQIAALPPAVG